MGSETNLLGGDAGGRKLSMHRKRQVDESRYLGDTSALSCPPGGSRGGTLWPIKPPAGTQPAALHASGLCDMGQTQPGWSLRVSSVPMGTASLWGEGRLWAVADAPASARSPRGRDAWNARPVGGAGTCSSPPQKIWLHLRRLACEVSLRKGTVFHYFREWDILPHRCPWVSGLN